ncbi:MAG: TIGR04438 family Trp-rich protein [Burkholderiales bacterium]|nr:TIGR04438 family Trp-rich protein [Burkholderiales bacterium]
MILIIAFVGLVALKYFEVGLVANLSWWWIVLLFVVAFIWFEFLERMLGLDKRAAHDKVEKNREERVKRTFEKKR